MQESARECKRVEESEVGEIKREGNERWVDDMKALSSTS